MSGPWIAALRWCFVLAACAAGWWYYMKPAQNAKSMSKASLQGTRKGQSDSGRDERTSKGKREKSRAEAAGRGTTNSKNRSNGTSGSSEQATNQKNSSKSVRKSPSVPLMKADTAVYGNSQAEENKEENDNREFAKLMTKAKKGTSLTKPNNDNSNKSRKAKKAAARLAAAEGSSGWSAPEMSTNSSTTGADADDDMSPVTSPPFEGVADNNVAPTSGDVSDMLELPGAGPSVLRLTNTEETSHKKPAQNEFKVQESKRQRYQRQKREALREEQAKAESARRALLEKQLRTAREAEGRQPRGGTVTSADKGVNNAWEARSETQVHTGTHKDVSQVSTEMKDGKAKHKSITDENAQEKAEGEKGQDKRLQNEEPQDKKPQNKEAQVEKLQDEKPQNKEAQVEKLQDEKPQDEKARYEQAQDEKAQDEKAGNHHVELLDTFESLESSKQSTTSETPNKTSWADDIPSEEEQMRRLNDMENENGWFTVSKRNKKKSSKAGTKLDGTSNDNSDAGSSFAAEKSTARASFSGKENVSKPAKFQTNGSSKWGHPDDSIWEAAWD